MPLNIGNLTLLMGPKEMGAPDDLKSTIINFIETAQNRLEIAVQELDNWEIANAIIAARQRKVTINIVMEGDYFRSSPARKNPGVPGGSLEINREIMNALQRANINCKVDFNTKIFHQKFIVRDREAVLTGSTNFTTTGISKNLNHILIIDDQKVARIYAREFREIMQGHFGKLNEGHDKAPPVINVSNIPVKILFAPDHNPEMEIMKQMAKASSRVDFAIFTFSQSSGIDDSMVVLQKAGISVRGIFDGKAGNQSWASTRMVHRAGAEAHLAKRRPNEGYSENVQGSLGKLHHKLMVIDSRLVIGGSFNYTGPANLLNDENIFILGDLHESDNTKTNLHRQLGKYVSDEIDRIIKVFGEKVQ